MLYVSTREELKEAINRREKEFIVIGDLANKLKPIVELKNLSGSIVSTLLSLVPVFITKSMETHGGALTAKEVINILSAKKGKKEIPYKYILMFVALTYLFSFCIVAMIKEYDFEVEANKKGVHIKCARNAKRKEHENNDDQEKID